MLGILVEIFMVAGLLFLFRIKRLKSFSAHAVIELNSDISYHTENILIMGSFLTLFLVTCWAGVSGIHNTEQSTANISALVPLIVLLALRGINALQFQFLKNGSTRVLHVSLATVTLLLVLIFALRGVYPYKRSKEEILAFKTGEWIKQNRNKYGKIYYNRPCYINILSLNPVRKIDSYAVRSNMPYDSIPAGSIIIGEPYDQLKLLNYCTQHLDEQSFHFKKIITISLFDKGTESLHPGESNLDVNLYVKRR